MVVEYDNVWGSLGVSLRPRFHPTFVCRLKLPETRYQHEFGEELTNARDNACVQVSLCFDVDLVVSVEVVVYVCVYYIMLVCP